MAKKRSLAGIPGKVTTFAREARDELRKVTWPTRQTTVRYTLIVIGASIVVGGVIGGLDLIFSRALERLLF